MVISQIEVYEAIKYLKINKGVGPDGIPAILLKNCIANITPILHKLFEKSLSEGNLPTLWKISFVTPVHKSDNKSNVKNYRPISIMSIIPKLFEKLITKKLMYLCKNIIIEEQHGFREKRSTVTNLLTLQNYLLDKVESNIQVDVIYANFAKAFDRVSHRLLLQKQKILAYMEHFSIGLRII